MIRLPIHDWRAGDKPRKVILDILLDNDWLEIDVNGQRTAYYLNISTDDVGKMIEILTEEHDVGFMINHFCVDTKGYKFTQR